MKKIFSTLLAALLVTGMTTVALADDAAQANDKNHFYGEMVDTGVRNDTGVWGWEGIIPGTAMAIGGTGEGCEADKAFDGNLGTVWSALENNWSNYKLVLKADEAVSPTGFFILANCDQTTGAPLRMHAINGSVIQGSNDGITWEDIYTITVEVYEDYAYGVEDGIYNAATPCYVVAFENEVPAYQYFAYANNDDGAAAAMEFGLFSGAVPVAEAPADDTPANDKNHFYGTMIDTGVRNDTGVWGWTNIIPGTVMGIGGDDDGYANAFDGNLSTVWSADANNWSDYKLVLKADEAVSPTGFFILANCDQTTGAPTRMHAINGSVIQGSNDGVTWEDIFTITLEVYEDYAFGVEDGTYNAGNPCYIVNFEGEVPAYQYFAYANNDDGAAAAMEFGLFYDNTAVEAPAEEAPATFDAGIIAAAVAVVSAAGYAIARKRK